MYRNSSADGVCQERVERLVSCVYVLPIDWGKTLFLPPLHSCHARRRTPSCDQTHHLSCLRPSNLQYQPLPPVQPTPRANTPSRAASAGKSRTKPARTRRTINLWPPLPYSSSNTSRCRSYLLPPLRSTCFINVGSPNENIPAGPTLLHVQHQRILCLPRRDLQPLLSLIYVDDPSRTRSPSSSSGNDNTTNSVFEMVIMLL